VLVGEWAALLERLKDGRGKGGGGAGLPA
jgi:hypothetical protein